MTTERQPPTLDLDPADPKARRLARLLLAAILALFAICGCLAQLCFQKTAQEAQKQPPATQNTPECIQQQPLISQ